VDQKKRRRKEEKKRLRERTFHVGVGVGVDAAWSRPSTQDSVRYLEEEDAKGCRV